MYRPFLLIALILPAWADVVVSPAGSDNNPGTADSPVQTLEKARALIRAQHGGTVWLRGGQYSRSSTFTLGPEDSNTVWQSWPGEDARISGGAVVTGFQPSSVGPYIYEVSLPAQGISNYGKLTQRGYGRPNRPAALEVFFKGRPMPLASWPDIGWAYTNGAPAGPQGGQFSVSTSHLSRWKNEPDLWVHGYWTYDWADSHEHVASLDTRTGIIKTDPPHGAYGYAAGKRFRVENALSELDVPGEWYLDRRNGMLYFLPPEPMQDGDIIVSLLETPLVNVTNGQNIRFLDVTFENTRGNAIEIHNGSAVYVSFSRVRNAGMVGVSIQGGTGNGVEFSDIRETGEGAIVLTGGDRKSLTPSGLFAEGNHIQHYSRWSRSYRPAIAMNGVGQRAVRNRIHHGSHQAIAISGNDHLIEGNDIHTVVWETLDAGAFYMGRDWTWRGNIVRANFFHNLPVNPDIEAVYLDDCASGTLVEGNSFQRAGREVLIGGGRDNIVRANLFIDGNPGVEVDARGLTWAKTWFDGTDNTMFDRLSAMPYKDPPWSVRYPELARILSDEPAVPKGNVVDTNASTGGTWTRLRDGTDKWVAQRNNITAGDFGFMDSGQNDLRLRDNSPLFAKGFSRPGFSDLGNAGDVLSYHVDPIAGKSNQVRLTVQNLGRAPAGGEFKMWAWPEQVVVSNDANQILLNPGETFTREFALNVTPGTKQGWVGVRLSGDDLRPPGTPVTLR